MIGTLQQRRGVGGRTDERCHGLEQRPKLRTNPISNVILNLNPPSAIADTSWIRPGKDAWDWWSGSQADNVTFRPGMNTATMEHYIDFASRAGLEYMMVDAGWAHRMGAGRNDANTDITRAQPNIDMPALLDFARSKRVKLWLWAHWSDVDRQMDQ